MVLSSMILHHRQKSRADPVAVQMGCALQAWDKITHWGECTSFQWPGHICLQIFILTIVYLVPWTQQHLYRN